MRFLFPRRISLALNCFALDFACVQRGHALAACCFRFPFCAMISMDGEVLCGNAARETWLALCLRACWLHGHSWHVSDNHSWARK